MSFVRSIKKAVLRAEIVAGLAWARLLIVAVPLRFWRGLLGPIAGGNSAAERATPEQEQQAIHVGRMIARLAGNQRFEAVCLPQALAGRWVLKRRGIPSQIVLGSRRDDSGLALHAWLKVGDSVVTGAKEYETYHAFAGRRPAGQRGLK